MMAEVSGKMALLFTRCCDEHSELLQMVTSLNTVQKRGKGNINLLGIDLDKKSEIFNGVRYSPDKIFDLVHLYCPDKNSKIRNLESYLVAVFSGVLALFTTLFSLATTTTLRACHDNQVPMEPGSTLPLALPGAVALFLAVGDLCYQPNRSQSCHPPTLNKEEGGGIRKSTRRREGGYEKACSFSSPLSTAHPLSLRSPEPSVSPSYPSLPLPSPSLHFLTPICPPMLANPWVVWVLLVVALPPNWYPMLIQFHPVLGWKRCKKVNSDGRTTGRTTVLVTCKKETTTSDVPGRASSPSPSPSPTRPDPPLGPGSGPPFLPDPESGLRKIVRYGLGSHLSYLEAFNADITFLSSDPSPTRPWVAVLRPDPSPGFQARPDPNNTKVYDR
ncbi:hypothetical protein B0H11DRAFT_2193109 [Mycena galericulata]|nr:hypothetical protein B0H11DRAFT_2193109 [Mycena galericulata]